MFAKLSYGIHFIHSQNTDFPTTKVQWDAFFVEANKSGIFLGGSEIANCTVVGNKPMADITNEIGGFMRFESEDKNKILALLEKHPVVIQGGTVSLCEMPKT